MDYRQLPQFFFRSKTRANILVRFVIGVKEELYLREIARIVKAPVGNVRRELLNLENVRLVKSRRVGNLKYFKMDTSSPLYEPYREIIVKTAGIPTLLKIPLASNVNIIAAFIYGSFAKGKFDNISDIDLFVLTQKNNAVFTEINEAVDRFENKFGREINVTMMTRKELTKKINDNDSFIRDIIHGGKMFIKGGKNDIRPESAGRSKS